MTTSKVQTKRKLPLKANNTRKRTKLLSSAQELPWKAVSRAYDTVYDGDDGILELDEVDGVEVVYEDTEHGKRAVFRVAEPTDRDHEEQASLSANANSMMRVEQTVQQDLPEKVSFDTQTLLPEWDAYDIHPIISRSLYAFSFTKPTPIQRRALPEAQSGRDIIGVAETGSGKTLAYGIPILSSLLKDAEMKPPQHKRSLSALILTPTRELALQVSSHLNDCLNDPASAQDVEQTTVLKKKQGKQTAISSPPSSKQPKGPPLVSVAAIVGGMSAQKQRRVLSRGVDILVVTPGRFWDLLEEDESLASQVRNLRFLVLDEADRMIETGHFEELDRILRLTIRASDVDDTNIPNVTDTTSSSDYEEDEPNNNMQTFVFSATMSKDLQQNLKKKSKSKFPGHSKKAKTETTLDILLFRLDFRDSDPQIIDLSPEKGVVASLKESRVECLSAEKDVYLYYFLLRYPGRSLVFLSSIDGIRRLTPLMDLLGLQAFPLHSQLEQRQRLKNLDRFKTTPNGILLATDIAARGLDIPAVDHVVHYQLPRSADVYVHRNGRTARASREGFSLLMCGPDDRRVLRGLLSSLHRDEQDIAEIATDLHMLDKLKARVQLARKIDNAQHKLQKENHDRKWLQEAADAMEVELDSDMDSDSQIGPNKRERKDSRMKSAKLKAELKDMLAMPLIGRGISTRYITSGSSQIVDDILNNDHHEIMLGTKKAKAGSEVMTHRERKPQRKLQALVHEEWNGIST